MEALQTKAAERVTDGLTEKLNGSQNAKSHL